MAAIYLTEEDVAWLLDIDSAIECVEEAFRQLATGQADNQPRRRVVAGNATLHVLAAGSLGLGYVGHKSYVTTRSGARFQFSLSDATTGQPVAIIEANLLGQMRTGAASGAAPGRGFEVPVDEPPPPGYEEGLQEGFEKGLAHAREMTAEALQAQHNEIAQQGAELIE